MVTKGAQPQFVDRRQRLCKLLDRVRLAIRAGHDGSRAGKSDPAGIKRFMFSHGKRRSAELGENDAVPSRRDFMSLLGAFALLPLGRIEPQKVLNGEILRMDSHRRPAGNAFSSPADSVPSRRFRIRTITAGLNLQTVADLGKIESAIGFLQQASETFQAAGYEIQTLRIATQPLPNYLAGRSRQEALAGLKEIDGAISAKNVLLSIGPVITDDRRDAELAPWAAHLVNETKNINFSVTVASPTHGIHRQAARAAAEAIVAIAEAMPGGEGNFRFTAAAQCPAGIPFFPAAYHAGAEAFSIGLESPPLLQAAFDGATGTEEATRRLKALLEAELGPLQQLARKIAHGAHRRYLGIDLSPAPAKDASIGQAIETLTGVPFGSASTLMACAAITDVLRNLTIEKCGYSGLMLPVLEDPVLARRAAEGRYGARELLLYSSVCGTGLDVVPLPGVTPVAALAALIGDVAALATKLHKPLSARLFPVPGKKAGDRVHFNNPFLTDSVVMKLD